MKLDDNQRQAVAQWIAAGAKLSEIQNRLAAEFSLKLTYMEARFLVDDLKLTPKDPEPIKPANSLLQTSALGAPPQPSQAGSAGPKPGQPPAGLGGVSISVDTLARPGAMVSGSVTFSDGNTAAWQLDQTGRLGLIPQKPGYRPPAADVQQFQMMLETELSKVGF